MLKLFVALQTRLSDVRTRQEGQAFTEYAVILAVVGVTLAGVLVLFRGALTTVFTNVTTALGL